MKELKILHLFPKRLSLYGEYGNAAVLKHLLEKQGRCVQIEEFESGSLSTAGYDLIYIGSGTEDQLMAANAILAEKREAVRESIGRGDLWLATGNAMTLFGTEILRKGKAVPAVGAFAYRTELNEQKRFMGDVLTTADNPFGTELVGFINTSSVYSGIENPMGEIVLNPGLGNDKKSASEGIVSNRFFGTQLVGPFVVKNPAAAKLLLENMTGEPAEIGESNNLSLAYAAAVQELRKRSGR